MAKPPGKTIVCDVGALVRPDLATVDALARLALVLRRNGMNLRLDHASRDLCHLLAFVGLREALGVEPGGEPEEREQRLGVEEGSKPHDPAG
jgi:hypothetical protein